MHHRSVCVVPSGQAWVTSLSLSSPVSPTRAVTNFCHALDYLNDHITAQRIELVFLFAGALTLEAVLVLADVGGAHVGILHYTGVFARSQIVYKRFCPEGSPIPRRSIAAGSEADLERARLLHQYALHQCRPDAERLPIKRRDTVSSGA